MSTCLAVFWLEGFVTVSIVRVCCKELQSCTVLLTLQYLEGSWIESFTNGGRSCQILINCRKPMPSFVRLHSAKFLLLHLFVMLSRTGEPPSRAQVICFRFRSGWEWRGDRAVSRWWRVERGKSGVAATGLEFFYAASFLLCRKKTMKWMLQSIL